MGSGLFSSGRQLVAILILRARRNIRVIRLWGLFVVADVNFYS